VATNQEFQNQLTQGSGLMVVNLPAGANIGVMVTGRTADGESQNTAPKSRS